MAGVEITLIAPNGRSYSQPIGLFIDNEFVPSSDGQMITSVNPTNESEIASVHAATAEDVDKAVVAARKALKDPSWSDLAPTERGKMMLKLADLVEAHAENLATIETWDNGKPYSVALHEDVAEVASVLRYYGGYADKIHGQVIDCGSAKLAYTIKEPIGVCGQVIPWNYPLAMASWKLGPALACGNTVVIKAAEQTPLSILYLAKLIKEAGFPPGVVNILNGLGRTAGAAIVRHDGVDKIAFTGSTMTGKEIMKMASGTMKNITLETGGKSPLLVFEDADLDQAVKWAHVGIMSNQGQVCAATSRLLVQRNVYNKFCEAFKAQVFAISIVGDPFEEQTFQGPQVTKAQHDNILRYISSGKSEGATLIAGGEPLLVDGKGFFINPTVFADVTPSMKIYQEEIFGPVVVITAFDTEEQALELANDTNYGLGAAVFTRDIARGHRVARKLEAGMVWINSSNDADFKVPFGGVKQSGIGRELGEEGLRNYCSVKAVHVNMGTML